MASAARCGATCGCRLRVLREDLLAMLYRVEELGAEKQLTVAEASEAVGGGWLVGWGMRELERSGRIDRRGEQLELTDQGRAAARKLVRTHRLWETYLVQHLGMPLDHVHEPAHRVEHFIDERLPPRAGKRSRHIGTRPART